MQKKIGNVTKPFLFEMTLLNRKKGVPALFIGRGKNIKGEGKKDYEPYVPVEYASPYLVASRPRFPTLRPHKVEIP